MSKHASTVILTLIILDKEVEDENYTRVISTYSDVLNLLNKTLVHNKENLQLRSLVNDMKIRLFAEARRPYKMSLALVVTRCVKPSDWINGIVSRLNKKFHVSVFDYEKCGGDFKLDVENVTLSVTKLPNVGREGHAWVYHLLNQSNAFSDLNFFLQGGKGVLSEN